MGFIAKEIFTQNFALIENINISVTDMVYVGSIVLKFE